MLKLSDFAFWSDPPVTFTDRADAGRRLAARLTRLAPESPLVLALPRGGVEVGFEIAEALHAPLDVVPARKLGAPHQPELAIGAIAPGAAVLNEHIIGQLELSREAVDRVIAEEEQEMERRAIIFRAGLPPLDVTDRTVIVVDDGLATGATAAAAIKSVRRGGPRRVILAAPVGSPEAVAALRSQVDELVCLGIPSDFHAVGAWYEDFSQTTDERVIGLLARAASLRTTGVSVNPQTPSGAGKTGLGERTVSIPAGRRKLEGSLNLPENPSGLVLFAHGSGSSRVSPRNVAVARVLQDAGMATLLFDLLTDGEAADRSNVFDIELLSERLATAATWCRSKSELATLPQGIFGASTGAAAALAAASRDPGIRAVVSRGGRPDLAGEQLTLVTASTLLIVGGADTAVIELNEQALGQLRCVKGFVVIPGATHLFEESGALEEVSRLASGWFGKYLHRPS